MGGKQDEQFGLQGGAAQGPRSRSAQGGVCMGFGDRPGSNPAAPPFILICEFKQVIYLLAPKRVIFLICKWNYW